MPPKQNNACQPGPPLLIANGRALRRTSIVGVDAMDASADMVALARERLGIPLSAQRSAIETGYAAR